MEIENGKITSTMLGFEDHGMFSCMIQMKFDRTGQGFGGYRLDTYSKDADCAKGTAFGIEFLMEVLKVVGVETWEELAGKHVRVKRENNYDPIIAIGHIVEDKWFEPKTLAESHKNK